MPPGDDGAGEVEEREVIGGLLGPTDQDAAEAVEPGVCSLDHPAARFGAGMAFGMGFLATGAQMQGDRSVGFGPVFSRPNGALPIARSSASQSQSMPCTAS